MLTIHLFYSGQLGATTASHKLILFIGKFGGAEPNKQNIIITNADHVSMAGYIRLLRELIQDCVLLSSGAGA
jgi:hypothetical protein